MTQPSADSVVDADAASLLPLVNESTALMRERRRFTHTTEAQRRCVVEWLEQPPNFQLLARGMPPVLTPDGRKLKKADGFRALTRHVNARTESEWDVETTRSRYESLVHTFHKARRMIESPDFGITTTDRSRGVTEERQKRDALCLFYDRLDALFRTGVALPGVEREPTEPSDSTDDDGLVPVPVPVVEALRTYESVADSGVVAVGASPVRPTASEPSAPLGLPVKEELAQLRADVVSQSVRVATAAVAPPLKRARLTTTSTGASSVGAATAAFVSRRASVEPSSTGSDTGSSRRASVEPSPSSEPASRSSIYSSSSYSAAADLDSTGADDDTKEFNVEAQKLALQQERLLLQKRELDLREQELAAQESMRKQSLRADLTTKLVTAGKSLAEIREYLALLEG